jgi:hypothetical protein
MRRLAALLLTTTALLGAACSQADEDPLADEAEADGGGTDGSGDAGADDSDGGGSVELLDPGAEPRQVLRLAPPDDCEQAVTIEQRTEQRIQVGPEEQTSTTGSELDVTHRCEAVDEDRIELTSTFDDVRLLEADPLVEDELGDLLEDIIGSEQRLVYDRQGRILDAELPDIDVDDPMMQDVLDSTMDSISTSSLQSASPFPTDAVGIGARWRVTTDIEVTGIGTRFVNEYTITALDGDRVDATVVSTMEFLPGPAEVEGLPSDALTVVSGVVSGTGTTTWDLRTVIARYEQTMDGTVTMLIDDGEGDVELVQDLHQEVLLRPR